MKKQENYIFDFLKDMPQTSQIGKYLADLQEHMGFVKMVCLTENIKNYRTGRQEIRAFFKCNYSYTRKKTGWFKRSFVVFKRSK